eukprot:3980146-Pyramimonas_sp.AAC.1
MVYLISPSLRNWMDVSNRARYYLLTRRNGGRQGQHAENFVADNITTRDYMHVDTRSVPLLRLPIREHPVRGPDRHAVDALVIPR